MQRGVGVTIPRVDARLILEKEACNRPLSFARGVVQRRDSPSLLGIDQIGTVFDNVFEPLNLFGLLVQGCSRRDLLQALIETSDRNSRGRHIVRAELDQRVLIGELAPDALVMRDGL